MDIRQLHYFLVLCEEMNYTRASQRLFLSRQALRQSITALEAELCGPLFVSAHHKLSLTERGLSYMVQGVRSARGHGSKLALFQPMFAVEFEGLESSRMQMHRFREVRSGIVLQSLPFDVRKSTIALFMAEVLYRLVKECEPNQRLFDFVWGSVAALDALDEGVANFHLWFLTNLSRFLGFSPGNAYLPGAWFDIREGSFTPLRPPHGEVLSALVQTSSCAL